MYPNYPMSLADLLDADTVRPENYGPLTRAQFRDLYDMTVARNTTDLQRLYAIGGRHRNLDKDAFYTTRNPQPAKIWSDMSWPELVDHLIAQGVSAKELMKERNRYLSDEWDF